ncbi:MAG: lytic transglycosylase domain-containing protein [Candidatus Aenigmatarchaeota archaeon]|nr:lytic transglycosylase domain-containing protein [Candidatus Aenigmarchaeota archaeon]
MKIISQENEQNQEKNEILNETQNIKFIVWVVMFIFSIIIVFAFTSRLFPKLNTIIGLIIKISAISTFNLWSFYILVKNDNTVKSLALVSSFILFGAVVIAIFSSQTFRDATSGITTFLSSVFNDISRSLCAINAEIQEKDLEECGKDYKKVGDYRGLDIKFGYPKYSRGSISVVKDEIDAIAGEPYNLQLVLINKNIDPRSRSYENTYDIKIKMVQAMASGKMFSSFTDQEVITVYDNNQTILRGGEYLPVVLKFDKMPSICANTVYFKVDAITEQTSKGIFKFYVDPTVGREEIRSEYSKINIEENLVSPGPVDVIGYSYPSIVLKENTQFDIIINIKNLGDGTASFENGKIVFGVDYIRLNSCDVNGNVITLQSCNDPKTCYSFSIANADEVKKSKGIMIRCGAEVLTSNYKDYEKTVLASVYVNYSYKTTVTDQKSIHKCIMQTQSTLPSGSGASSSGVTECRDPNVCMHPCIGTSCNPTNPCPNGYTVTKGFCSQPDTICCAKLTECKSPYVCMHSCSSGYIEVPGICSQVDTVCCAPENLVLQNNCETDKQKVINKIVTEAKRQGVKPSIVLAITETESGFMHCWSNGNIKISPSGAIGVMQLMPGECSDPYDINKNIECGVRQFKSKCDSSASIAIRNGFTCTGQGSCTTDVSCTYDCSPNFYAVYTGWDLAIRAYNGWGCCVRLADGTRDCTSSIADGTRKYVDIVKNRATKYTMYD